MIDNDNYLHVTFSRGRFELDEKRRVLLRKGHKSAVKIDPAAFDALCFFVKREGEVFANRELFKHHQSGWTETLDSDLNSDGPNVKQRDVIYKIVSKVRAALGDSKDKKILTSIRGRGYKFVADIEPSKKEFEIQPASTGVLTGLGKKVQETFWSTSNIYFHINLKTRKQVEESSWTGPLPFGMNLEEAIEEYLADLELAVRKKGPNVRFISTNACLNFCGISSWHADASVRRLVEETGRLLAKKKQGFECWRVFFYSAENELSSSDLVNLFAVLEENRNLGLHVAIARANQLPSSLPKQFAEFHCLPGKKLFLSVPPYYYMSALDKKYLEHRQIIDVYSRLANSIVERAENSPCKDVFAWKGNTLNDLAANLEGEFERKLILQ